MKRNNLLALLLVAVLVLTVLPATSFAAEIPEAGIELSEVQSQKKLRKIEEKRMWKRDKQHILQRRKDRLLPSIEAGGDVILDPRTGEEYSLSRLILTVEEGTPREAMDALFARYRMEVLYDYQNLSMYAVKLERTLTMEELDALIEALSQEQYILGVERDHVVHTTGVGGVTADM